MDFIDLFNDIARNLRNYFHNTARDLKISFEIEKLRYQIHLFRKRKENMLLEIGQSVYENYLEKDMGNHDFNELFTLSEILDSFIMEKTDKIRFLTDTAGTN